MARSAARAALRAGGRAVALLGSYSRGEAHPGSDLDLVVLGRRSFHDYRWREGYLVSVQSKPLRGWRAELDDPRAVGAALPAWRDAVLLYDRRGELRALQAEARGWTWARLGAKTDRYVARELASWAEEVLKMGGLLAVGNRTGAVVRRYVLAFYLPPLLATHQRFLYARENLLWEELARRIGPEWRRAQEVALGLRPSTLSMGCAAAAQLYAIAAETIDPILDPVQRRVVRAAVRFARRTIEPAPARGRSPKRRARRPPA